MGLISRRLFVQGSAAIAIGTTTGWALANQSPLGLQLYSVNQNLLEDVSRTLHRVKSIGYTRVETAGFAGLTAQEFRACLDAEGLECHSMHLPVGDHEVEPLFQDAHALGAKFVVTSALFAQKSSDERTTADDYKAMADRLNRLGYKAQLAGLRCAYHNHNFEFRNLENGRTGYDVLLERTDAALVDFELDCGWAVAAGSNPIDYFARYPRRFKMLHIKDFMTTTRPSFSLAESERPQGTELGRGHIDYRPILKAAIQAGIKDYYVEQEPPFPDMKPLEAIRVDYEYLRTL
jgi:sugar phosphate isomerase/epimerase